jgi:hypothetical protein
VRVLGCEWDEGLTSGLSGTKDLPLTMSYVLRFRAYMCGGLGARATGL